MSHHREALADLMRRPQEQVDLAQAALLVACEAYPDLKPDVYTGLLDAMAKRVRASIRPSAGAPKILQALNAYLFDELGFKGNEDNYGDPRNSFLNDVLERRTGIPITLSIVYLEVARRLGVDLCGVGMPGHFLVKFPRREGEVVMDPYHGGVVLSARELRERIIKLGGDPEHAARYLSAVTKRQIITRMLNNLKQTYLGSKAYDEALGIVELQLVVNPWSLDEVRDRGLIHHERGAYSDALRDLETYLQYREDAEDAQKVHERVEMLRPRVAGQNEPA
jgi:regulator of sirC expression with transglutaminase-like and TPR domain